MNYQAIIVDDDDMCLYLHTAYIKIAAFHPDPVSFDSGEKALAYLRSASPDIPVVIFLDINMPQMNGWQFLDVLQQEFSARPLFVAMVTSSVNARDREKAAGYSNVVDFIEKPIDEPMLTRLRLKIHRLGV